MKIDKATSKIAKLKQDIMTLTQELAKIAEEQQTADKIRAEEKAPHRSFSEKIKEGKRKEALFLYLYFLNILFFAAGPAAASGPPIVVPRFSQCRPTVGGGYPRPNGLLLPRAPSRPAALHTICKTTAFVSRLSRERIEAPEGISSSLARSQWARHVNNGPGRRHCRSPII